MQHLDPTVRRHHVFIALVADIARRAVMLNEFEALTPPHMWKAWCSSTNSISTFTPGGSA